MPSFHNTNSFHLSSISTKLLTNTLLLTRLFERLVIRKLLVSALWSSTKFVCLGVANDFVALTMAYNASRASAQRHPSEENSSKGASSNANREPGFSTVDQGPVTRHILESGNQESSSSNSQPHGQAQALQSAEACKRRCLGRDTDQKPLDSTKFGSDSVKALFNIGTSRIEPGQAHTSPSGGSHTFVPFKALTLGPNAPHSFAPSVTIQSCRTCRGVADICFQIWSW